MDDHDSGYKHLFAHTRMMRDLLLGFGATAGWVQQLDLNTLSKVHGSHVADDLRSRHSDLIWRVRAHSGQALYMLLEFQSQVDPHMALRTLVYSGLLCQDLLRSGALGTNRKLPTVLPIVLYNGESRWRAPQTYGDIAEAPIPGLATYQPGQTFLLIDEGAFPEHDLERLAPARNLASILFRMENSRTPEQLQTLVALLIDWLDVPEHADLRRAFTQWLRRVLLPRRFPGAHLPELQDLQEVNTMLSERVKEWTREWRQEGLAQGMAEGMEQGMARGRAQGRAQGEQAVLLRLLHRRFGELPEAIQQRLEGANREELETWADRILDAATLEEIFR